MCHHLPTNALELSLLPRMLPMPSTGLPNVLFCLCSRCDQHSFPRRLLRFWICHRCCGVDLVRPLYHHLHSQTAFSPTNYRLFSSPRQHRLQRRKYPQLFRLHQKRRHCLGVHLPLPRVRSEMQLQSG